MNLPSFSVQRPVFTVMVTLMVVVLGLVSLGRLHIDLLPAIELPTLTVRTEYEGASPVVMERLVTQIVEEIVATVPGVEELTSSSTEGSSRVRVTFTWGTDIDAAAMDVRSRIEDEISELPDNVERPRISTFDVASYPVVILGISSPLDPVELTRIIEEHLRFRLARIAGVAQVDTWGATNREIRVALDAERVKALGIPLHGIVRALTDANLDLPAGTFDRGRHEVTVRAPAEFLDLDQIRNTTVTVRDGRPVTIGQIANVRDTHEKRDRIVRLDGNRGLRIAIRKQPGANTVDVAAGVLAEITAINRDYPMLDVVPVINQGNFIERSIRNVARSVLYGGGLAVLVLLFFLGSIRSTVIISLAIPISIIATFALIFFGGFTINLMSLGGLALGVGMMVDSAVVVLENIYRRRREEGEAAGAAAAVAGAAEVSPAILAGTLTTVVVFLPLAFVRGVSGLLFKELALTVMFSLTCSLLVALSLVPMLAARMLAAPGPADAPESGLPRSRRHPWTARLTARVVSLQAGLVNGYARLLTAALRRRGRVIALSAALLGASLLLIPGIGTEFLPPSDEGEVRVTGEMEVGTRLDLVDRQTRRLEEIVIPAVPEAVSSVTSVTAGGRSATAVGDIQLALRPTTERGRSNIEIADDLRRRLAGRIPGMKIRTRAPQGQFLLERILGSDEGLTIEVRGFDLDTLSRLAKEAAVVVADVDGITDVEISRREGVPEEAIVIDREKAADLGLSVRDIAETLETALAGTKAGEFRAGEDSYRILVQLDEPEKMSIDDILDLVLTTPEGRRVTLKNVVRTVTGRGPAIIERRDRQRAITIAANVAGRDAGSTAADVRAALAGIAVPEGFELRVAGSIEEQQRASRELTVSLVLALVLVFMVLACQYESLVDPLIVMLSVPLAGAGVLVTLWLTNTTLNLQSFIGCIMLGGIVVNNAILLVDQAGRLRAAGMAAATAAAEAGRRRLRPILMTTLTTVLALVPLALGLGEGADAQSPMARAVVGGLSASTAVTLVLIPAVYAMVHRETEAGSHDS